MSLLSRFLCYFGVAAAATVMLAMVPAEPVAAQSAANTQHGSNDFFHGHGNPNPGIAPIFSEPYGYSYGEWQARFWKWYGSTPFDKNPVFDETGEHFHEGQVGPVWFLPGGFQAKVERNVTLPHGKALYIPLVTVAFWNKANQIDPPAEFSDLPDAKRIAKDVFHLNPDHLSDEQLLRLLGLFVMKYADGFIEINGQKVKKLKSYLSSTPDFRFIDQDLWHDFNLDFPKGHFLVGAGYAVLLNPLPKGKHTIRVKVKLDVPDDGLSYLNLEAEVIHHITVGKK